MTFRARELREGTPLEELRRELNGIQKEIAADLLALRTQSPVTPLVTESPYSANYGQIVRVAPPSGGLRLILPPVNIAVPNGRVVAIVETSTGALSVEAIDSTINGSTTVTYLAGVGTVEFLLTPTGWYAWSSSLITVALTSLASQAADTFVGNVTAGAAVPTAVGLSTLAGAGLTFGSHTLAVGAGDGIDVNEDDVAVDVTDIVDGVSITEVATNNIQRAALTGVITATAGLNATLFGASVAGSSLALSGGSAVIDYVGSTGTLALGNITGAQGVVDISTVACGGIVNHTAIANYTIDGFTAKTEGFWFVFVDRNTAGGAAGTFTNNTGNTTTSIRPPGAVNFTTFTFGRVAIFAYANNRWRPLVGATA